MGFHSSVSLFLLLLELSHNSHPLEQISLNHLSPFLSSNESPPSEQNANSQFELKVWRNPFNLFRG